ncbi:MAG: ATP-binding cassette domain-containing protein [Pseudomonadales bacterium]|jgi:oligopeptide/dipeptide ABC transporter ATP-binding protein|nr:ATP-binding cassette domain-containing protein [Pseudomonadales bacterium]
MLIEATALRKFFSLSGGRQVHAVDEVSLGIAEHEVVGLVGESGSGKTTFGKTLIGLHDKSGGEVRYRGELLPARYGAADFRKQASEIQMIFQDPYGSLNPRMTIFEIIAEGLAIREGRSLAALRDKVVYWLERVGLHADHLSRYPHEFSGGQRQRVGIARALIVEPKLLICDEPISALDVSVQAQVVQLLGELQASMGLSMLFIAHDLSMVRYVSNRMAVMYLGSLIELGPAEDLYFRPLHPYTQLLIASNPEPDPEHERQRQDQLISGEIPSPVDLKAHCRFAGRCPKAEARCFEERPALREVLPGRLVACHLL